LQALDRILSRAQRVDLGAQRRDLLDLLVELGVLGPDEIVAGALRIDLLVDADRDDHRGRRCGDADQCDQSDEVFLAPLAAHLPVREQVDAHAHASNLRIARPVATSSAGASARSWRSRIVPATSMPWNGLRTSAGTCVRCATASASPGTTDEPPAR